MKRIACGLLLLTACGTSPRDLNAPVSPSNASPATTTETTVQEAPVVRLSPPDEQEAPEVPPSTNAPEVPQTTPPRPAQREVSAPPATILEIVQSSTLLSCLKQWESGDGATSDNLYQFDQATWEAAGGTGSPDNASEGTQDAVAQNWIDQGYLRQAWAAQRGRCF